MFDGPVVFGRGARPTARAAASSAAAGSSSGRSWNGAGWRPVRRPRGGAGPGFRGFHHDAGEGAVGIVQAPVPEGPFGEPRLHGGEDRAAVAEAASAGQTGQPAGRRARVHVSPRTS